MNSNKKNNSTTRKSRFITPISLIINMIEYEFYGDIKFKLLKNVGYKIKTKPYINTYKAWRIFSVEVFCKFIINLSKFIKALPIKNMIELYQHGA